MYYNCLRCERPLKNKKSQEVGYGKVCLAKVLADKPTDKDEMLDEEREMTTEQFEKIALNNVITLKGNWDTRRVWLNGKELDPGYSQAVKNHSPDGFNWGYGGSGPAQLALAIMLDITKNRQVAQRLYQNFKFEVIAALPQADFDRTFDIGKWLKSNADNLALAS